MTLVLLLSGLSLSLTGCFCSKKDVVESAHKTEEVVTRTVTKEVIEQDTK